MQNAHNQHPSDCSDITGVILAGGRSRRMGQDKATLRVAGQSLFDRARAALTQVFSRNLIAGDRPDLACDALPSYPDIYPGSALGGIHGGLTAASTPWIFVVPCDLARPNPELIRLLPVYRHGYDVVVPRTPGGFEPVFALYHKRCLEPMEEMLNAGHYRIYDFYTRVRVRYLEPSELPADVESSLFNLNTPEDVTLLRLETP